MASAAYDVLYKIAPVVAEHLTFQNATTTQNELYGDVNLEHLNWLERQWASFYIWMGNAIIATGVMSFVLHEVSSAINSPLLGDSDSTRSSTLDVLSPGCSSIEHRTFTSGSFSLYVTSPPFQVAFADRR